LLRHDFTYSHYLESIDKARAMGYRIATFKDIKLRKVKGSIILFRHDIDFSLERAAAMAEVEKESNVRATYFPMLHSPYYYLFGNRHLLKTILQKKHDVGLHYEVGMPRESENLKKELLREIRVLESYLGFTIAAFSEHNPRKIAGEAKIKGYLNAYAMSSFKYISDSVQHWREGCLCQHLGSFHRLQVLIHPIWWTEEGSDRKTILRKLERLAVSKVRETYSSVRKLHEDYLRNLSIVPDHPTWRENQ